MKSIDCLKLYISPEDGEYYLEIYDQILRKFSSTYISNIWSKLFYKGPLRTNSLTKYFIEFFERNYFENE